MVAAAGVLLSSCATANGAGQEEPLTVLAAASLKEPFGEIARMFEHDHPGVRVRLVLGGSADLVTQLAQGAPADVLATADITTMARAQATGSLSGTPTPFATNTMTIAVEPGNPRGLAAVSDLARGDLAVVVCAPAVPCGAAAQRVAHRAGVRMRPVSEEGSVAGVLGKVATGQADAGVVYVTDVAGSGGSVEGVPIPAAVNTTNTYPVALVAGTSAEAHAASFVDVVLGDRGQQVLTDAGFGPP
jgi:molybdate transport system substrate-binding protein